MKVAVPKERRKHETRVAASPETVKKIVALGLEVVVETEAGQGASISDAAFEAAGARIASNAAETLKDAVEKLAAELTGKPPVGLELAKHLIHDSIETDLRVGLAHEAEAFGILASTEDFTEGVAAFLEKRKPKFTGT